MRDIHLHGALGDEIGSLHRLAVETPAEAVRALVTNYPQIIPLLRDGSFHIVRGDDLETGLSFGEEELTFRLGAGDLHIVPVVAGSKQNGVLKVVLGVALLGVGLFMGFATPILGMTASGSAVLGLTYGNLAMMGAALALAGVSSMLTGEEKSKEDKESSFTMAGPGNSYEQGNPVPIVYGEVITGGVLISGGVDIERIAVGA